MAIVTAWRLVGSLLVFGAVWDFAFGLCILLFTGPLAALLRLEIPADPVYLGLDGLLLIILAAIYGAASRQPERYAVVALVSGIGRVIGFFFFLLAWAGGRPYAFLVLGVCDLTLGAATLVAWRRAIAISD